MAEVNRKKLSLIVFSGDLDKLFAAFTIATGAAASGMDVVMFFTFWGLRALKKKGPPAGACSGGCSAGCMEVISSGRRRAG